MPLQHFITHRIEKSEKDPGASFTHSEDEANLEQELLAGFCQHTAQQLKGILAKRGGRRYGAFHPEITQVAALLKDWQAQRQSFAAVTRRIGLLLSGSLDNSEYAIDGFFAFFVEQLADSDRLYVFHLQHRTSVSVAADMSLSETHYLDFASTGFGIMLNLTDWQQQQDNYLTWTYGRADRALQNHFADVLGFCDTLDSAEETREFLQAVEDYSQQLPAEKSHEYKSKVVEYCVEQDMRGEQVDVKELSEFISATVETEQTAGQDFAHYVVARQQQDEDKAALPSTLTPDRKTLKQYLRYNGKNRDLSISFSAHLLDETIHYHAASDTLTIKTLPDSLRKQLRGDD
ncbi:hypothetical protein CHH28_16540 [Bacterioplanes sanyensis]|uniref:Nucleoid-associated protein YejK n=1 Tax=Bacterioplanes sanyensis TaxID=1249553 RepID=A0A222FNU8_9GAMM|nr:nucleoid-associated protein [Bacterioplanes sanyensis]ASP40184.1 hypothetical protein CHH28_16540 [Bacterioplanes sanyensis]